MAVGTIPAEDYLLYSVKIILFRIKAVRQRFIERYLKAWKARLINKRSSRGLRQPRSKPVERWEESQLLTKNQLSELKRQSEKP